MTGVIPGEILGEDFPLPFPQISVRVMGKRNLTPSKELGSILGEGSF